MDITCNTVAGEKKHRDMLWTTQCSIDTLEKGIWDITVWNWFSADETEQWGAMRAHGTGPHWTQCIPSGLVKIRLVVSKLWLDDSHLKWTPTNWPQSCLHYSWLTACSICLHGSNFFLINWLIDHLIHFLKCFFFLHLTGVWLLEQFSLWVLGRLLKARSVSWPNKAAWC